MVVATENWQAYKVGGHPALAVCLAILVSYQYCQMPDFFKWLMGKLQIWLKIAHKVDRNIQYQFYVSMQYCFLKKALKK